MYSYPIFNQTRKLTSNQPISSVAGPSENPQKTPHDTKRAEKWRERTGFDEPTFAAGNGNNVGLGEGPHGN